MTQAFLYNAIFSTFGLVLTTFFGLSDSAVPFFLIPFGFGNFIGPLLLGRLFDTVGRRPMISATYLLAGAILAGTGYLFANGTLSLTWQIVSLSLVFFFASAGASSGHLTVSETFPLEIRAMAIAFFYACATGLGGILGPAVFGQLISSGSRWSVYWGYLIGAGLMIGGGITELFLGVKAERQSLEDIAKPISAEEAEEEPGGDHQPRPDGQRLHSAGPARRVLLSGLPTVVTIPPIDSEIQHEVETLVRTLHRYGRLSTEDLAVRSRARLRGPGRFRRALRVALRQGLLERVGRHWHPRVGPAVGPRG